jgi:hypothetical protein
MIEKIGSMFAVVHSGNRKSKRDKPKGTVIKKFKKFEDALAMHRAIIMSKKRRGKS